MRYAGVWPEGKFGTFVADPPWPGGLATPRLGTVVRSDKTAYHQTVATWNYDQMSMEELKAMAPDVMAHATDDAHLWLWCTNMFLLNGEALNLCKAWGF